MRQMLKVVLGMVLGMGLVAQSKAGEEPASGKQPVIPAVADQEKPAGKEYRMTVQGGPWWNQAYLYRQANPEGKASTWSAPVPVAPEQGKPGGVQPAADEGTNVYEMVVKSGDWSQTYRYRRVKGDRKQNVWEGPVAVKQPGAAQTPLLPKEPSPIMPAAYGPGGIGPDSTIGAPVEVTMRNNDLIKGTVAGEDLAWFLVQTNNGVVSIHRSAITMVRWPQTQLPPVKPAK
jgi:hypothetical protein